MGRFSVDSRVVVKMLAERFKIDEIASNVGRRVGKD